MIATLGNKATETVVTIDEDGVLSFIYSDAMLPFIDAAGWSIVVRASHVEPTIMHDGRPGWNVDMSPVGGPASLGVYRERAAALAAEVQWLKENHL